MACLSVSFEEILGGAAGQVEAEAAATWLSKQSLYELPGDLVHTDESGLDMRVVDADFHKRRRRTSGAHLLPALQPQARNPTGKAAGKRPALSAPPQQPPLQQRKLATAAAPAAQAAKPPAAENLYSRAAYLSHGDAIGLAARRKGRPSTEFQLPPGWQPHGPPVSKARGSKPQQQKPVAAPAGKQQGGDAQQQAEQQQYMSPEGLVLPSLQRVQAIVQGPVVAPIKLVRWLKAAAADPAEAQRAGVTAVGQAHLLGLMRIRVLRIEGDRQQMQQRLKAAAAPNGGALGALPSTQPQQAQPQQRRRSQRMQPA